jgi:hypothetical protein
MAVEFDQECLCRQLEGGQEGILLNAAGNDRTGRIECVRFPLHR